MTATLYTLKEIADFCLEYGRKAFPEHDTEQILYAIIKADAEQKLYIVADTKGLCGACIISVFDDNIFVHHIVCRRSGFKTFIVKLSEQFPGREIRGDRKEKLKIYWKT